MARITRTAGVLFLAASSVYSNGVGLAIAATSARPAGGATPTDVRLLDDAALEAAAPTAPATSSTEDAAAIDPFGGEVAFSDAPAASQPTAGQSVSADQVATTTAGTVEIHVNDANIVEVLRMLSLQSQRNIMASKDVKGTVTANLYDVTVQEALDAILKANGYAYREQGNVIYVQTEKEAQDQERRERQPVTEVIRLHYSNAADVAKLITPMLSKEAGEVSLTPSAKAGIDLSSTEVGGSDHALEDMLVVKDFPDVLERVKRLIKEIDRRPQQVLVEATILRARLSETNSLGVNVTFSGGVDLSTLATSATGSQPTGGGVDQISSGNLLNNNTAGPLIDDGVVGGQIGGGGLKLGLIKNNVGVFIQALEGITDTTVLANPKVLVLNKQKGSVLVGNRDGYRDTTTVAEGGTSTVGSVKFLETGTRLIFRPYIGDNGFIRMEVHPEDSTGGINSQGLPSSSNTEVTTNVMVRDGRTIVIGGLFRDETSNAKQQVPGLGSIPVLGALFRQKNERQTREEVIILLTPHIIKDEDGYADASEHALAEAEKIRVGMRKNMMWFGRSRLAEGAYEAAVNELNKPKPNRDVALWHLDIATNLNPQFVEAIDLKQDVSGKVVTATSSSEIRSFIRQAVIAEQTRIQAMPPATTMPSGVEEISAATTQPAVSIGAAATTQPTQPTHAAATTQPATAIDALAGTEAAPATQPAIAHGHADLSEAEQYGDVESSSPMAHAPTDAATDGTTDGTATIVTEWTDELAVNVVAGEDATAAVPVATTGAPLAAATGREAPATRPAPAAPVAVSVLEDEPEILPVAPAPVVGASVPPATAPSAPAPVAVSEMSDEATALTEATAPAAVTTQPHTGGVAVLDDEQQGTSPVVSAPVPAQTTVQTPAGPATVNARVRKSGASGTGRTFEVRVTVETEDSPVQDEPMAVRVRDASVTPTGQNAVEPDTTVTELPMAEINR